MSSTSSMLIYKLAPYNGEHYFKNCRGLKYTGGHLHQPYLVWGTAQSNKDCCRLSGGPFTAGEQLWHDRSLILYNLFHADT